MFVVVAASKPASKSQCQKARFINLRLKLEGQIFIATIATYLELNQLPVPQGEHELNILAVG